MLEKFLAIISSLFSLALSLFSFWNLIVWTLISLKLFQSSHRLSSFLFILLPLFCSTLVISTSLSSPLLIHSSASHILLSLSSHEFISVIVFFNSAYLFFKSSISLLNVSGNLSILASNFFLRSCIIFTIITLKSFSWRLLISSSRSCFSGIFFSFLDLALISLSFHFV